ncbi:protoporphyrinogen oxidase [Angustibacter luteus]|uniref:Coproporphyrinogen III oxidase n=1 Tax=Angustibacter luteus TaxID=658456 RepID=A0ABW1JAI4_9ACTN
MLSVAVVGAGITGLSAAWELTSRRPDVSVVLLEASSAVGGKLALGAVAGLDVDLGAESVLARRPEAVDLAREVGLGADLEAPRAIGASVWSAGALRALPAGTLMGVPGRLDTLTGLLSAAEVAEVRAEPAGTWAPLEGDVDVASFVAQRVGPAVVERLVEPLLGGVYAGSAANLSLRATVPALWRAAVAGTSVVDAARAAAAAGVATRGAGPGEQAAPVFVGVRGGVGRLPVAVAAALRGRGVDVRLGVTVRELGRRERGWRLVTGPTTDPEALDVDAVVLAVPAAPTARLLRDEAPLAAAELAAVEAASMAIVTFAFRRNEIRGLLGSGVLVPPVDGRYVKAATFSSAKWGWLDEAAGEHVVLRASVGRHGQVADLQRPDDELVQRVLADLRALPGAVLPEPVDHRVTRWGGGLPQYAVGHVGAMARVADAVAGLGGLELAGATYEGVGIPACVASGRAAGARVATHLDGRAVGYGTLGG